MSEELLYKLCDKLCIYLEKKNNFVILSLLKSTLYYLADEGRLCKAANHTQLYLL